MRIDVLFGVQQLTPQDVQGRLVAVIDVLRASTTIAVALSNGARTILPMESPDDAVTRAKQRYDWELGEQALDRFEMASSSHG